MRWAELDSTTQNMIKIDVNRQGTHHSIYEISWICFKEPTLKPPDAQNEKKSPFKKH